VADIVPPSTALVLVNKMNEKSKPTSSSTIQVKNRRKAIRIEEKLDNSGGSYLAQCIFVDSLQYINQRMNI